VNERIRNIIHCTSCAVISLQTQPRPLATAQELLLIDTKLSSVYHFSTSIIGL